MENALESLSKEDLIALTGQKDLLLQERQKHHVQALAQKQAEIDKLRRMLFGRGGGPPEA